MSTAQPTPALTIKEESTIAAETPALEESDDEVSDDESEYGAVDGLEKIQAEGLEPCKMVSFPPSSLFSALVQEH